MKKITSMMLFLIAAITMQAQMSKEDFKPVLEEYEKYCNERVLDTILVEGTVFFNYIPFNDNNTIPNSTAQRQDTIWENPACPLYKEYYGISIEIRSDYNFAFGLDNFNRDVNNLKGDKVKVVRQHICKVKRSVFIPFSDQFWEWLKQ